DLVRQFPKVSALDAELIVTGAPFGVLLPHRLVAQRLKFSQDFLHSHGRALRPRGRSFGLRSVLFRWLLDGCFHCHGSCLRSCQNNLERETTTESQTRDPRTASLAAHDSLLQRVANFWIRPFIVSATYRLSWLSSASPCGRRKRPASGPSGPRARRN